MNHSDHKQFWKRIFAVLFSAVVCMSFAAGCSHGASVQSETAAPQTTASVQETAAPALQTSAPAPTDTHTPDAGCDALFYGDSITKGNHFDTYFPQLRIVDFGIGGATIESLTERVPEVSACHPARIFVMAGGNNLYSCNEQECVDLFRGLLDALREACPYAEIFVESMLPTDNDVAAQWDCPNSVIRTFNKHLAELAAEYGMTYLDIYPAYEYRGGLDSSMTRDGVHLKSDSFGPWAEVLRPYLEP
ncbi:MAG: hypothetical protein J5496_07790 [Lachnospiraceae bacterium]|nr:hypothetical protein [Lachnospiraceae bacterium]